MHFGIEANQPNQSNQTVKIFVHNQTLFIRGLKSGEQYTVYSVLGKVIIQGKVTNELEQQVTLHNKGVFIVSTPTARAKVLVK